MTERIKITCARVAVGGQCSALFARKVVQIVAKEFYGHEYYLTAEEQMENGPVATEAATAEEASTAEETTAETSTAEDEEEFTVTFLTVVKSGNALRMCCQVKKRSTDISVF